MPGIILSVIIPTYNREEILKKCINAFLIQNIPNENFEIIIVDNGTDAAVVDSASKLSLPSQLNIQYLKIPDKGANRARNKGISAAKGRLLFFINDDTIASPELIQEHIAWHGDNFSENIAVLGKMQASPDVEPTGFNKLHLDANYRKIISGAEIDWRYFFTCNISVKKSFLEKFGTF
ncbi:MAG: glycosyltransferase family A protein, partial [Candidatus Omnitrophota bacterium]